MEGRLKKSSGNVQRISWNKEDGEIRSSESS